MTDHKDQKKSNLDLQVIGEYNLTALADLSQLEEGRSGNADYILCSAEELRALVSEIRRLQKEVDYLREALYVEERQAVRFRREHDCY